MRIVLTSVLAAVLAASGAAVAQTPGQPVGMTPAAPVRAAYTVEPFTPAAPITIQGTGVRLRAEPFTGNDTPVLSTGSTGLALTVVGLTRQPDWAWYQVILRNGQKAFIRSDLTSAPMQGGARVATPAPVATPALPPRTHTTPQAGAITMTPQPLPGGAPAIDIPRPSAPAVTPAPAIIPAPAPLDSGLISVAPAAPTPRMTPASGSLADHVMAQLVDKRCWTDSSSMMDAHRLKATFSLSFGADGKLAGEPVLIDPALAPSDDPAMTVFIAKARASLRTCNALGFNIPAEYGSRSDVRVQFRAR
jgi:hypothetical protein